MKSAQSNDLDPGAKGRVFISITFIINRSLAHYPFMYGSHC
jgi:hypothetical protein